MIKYFLITGFAALFSLAITPAIRRLAIWAGAIDVPGGRRIHAHPTPRFGGLAVLIALVSSVTMASLLDPFTKRIVTNETLQLIAVGVGAICITTIGLVDDRRSVRPVRKLLVEIGAAVMVVNAGFRIENVLGLSLGWLSASATVLWIVAITNAVNMVDGLDGLATGLGLIISATLLSIALYLGISDAALMLAALCGSLLGFLPHNSHPARIFLGDSGSLLVGFLLAVTALKSCSKAATVAAILVPMLALGIPLAEIVLTTLRRVLRAVRVIRPDERRQRYEFVLFERPTLFTADRDHIHHRLLAKGISQRNVVLVLYGLCSLLCCVSFLLVAYHVTNIALLIGVFGLAALGARRLGYNELQPFSRGLLLPLFDLPALNRRLVYVCCDLGFIALSYLGAWLIRSDGDLSRTSLSAVVDTLPLLAAIQMSCFVMMGLYQRTYRYAGIADFLAMTRTLVAAMAGSWLAFLVAGHFERPSVSLVVLDTYLLATCVVGSRLSFNMLNYLFSVSRSGMKRALIYGAGSAGTSALHEIQSNPELGLEAVSFIDDDPLKCGRMLHGIPIRRSEELEELINRREVNAIVVATQKIPLERLNKIAQRCALAGVSMRGFTITLDEIRHEALQRQSQVSST